MDAKPGQPEAAVSDVLDPATKVYRLDYEAGPAVGRVVDVPNGEVTRYRLREVGEWQPAGDIAYYDEPKDTVWTYVSDQGGDVQAFGYGAAVWARMVFGQTLDVSFNGAGAFELGPGRPSAPGVQSALTTDPGPAASPAAPSGVSRVREAAERVGAMRTAMAEFGASLERHGWPQVDAVKDVAARLQFVETTLQGVLARSRASGGGTYREGVVQLVRAADQVGQEAGEVRSFADGLDGNRWGSGVVSAVQEASSLLLGVEERYRGLAEQMNQEGRNGAAAHDSVPYAPDPDGLGV